MKNAIDFETTQGKSSGAGHQSRIARDRQPKTTSGYQKPRSSGSSKYFEDDTGTRGSQDTISTDFIVVSKTTRAVSSARFLFLFFFFFSSTDGSKWDYSLWTIEANNSKLEYSTGFLQRQVRHSGASDQSGAGKLDQTCCFLSLLKIVSKVTLVERGSLSLIYASPVHFFGAGGGSITFQRNPSRRLAGRPMGHGVRRRLLCRWAGVCKFLRPTGGGAARQWPALAVGAVLRRRGIRGHWPTVAP